MYRDFSEKSRNELLGLVSQVENEKISNFTDWVGDRWYDFESWIGILNIRNYLNNVNEYHKKVIDKNNATKSSINTIFNKVKSVDASYKNTFSIKKSQLQQWQRYIDELSQIVNPRNGKFNAKYMMQRFADDSIQVHNENFANLRKYLAEILDKDIGGASNLFRFLTGNPTTPTGLTSCLSLRVLMKYVSSAQQDKQSTNKNIKTGLTFLSGLNKNIGKYGKKEGVTLSSSILSYIGTLCGIANSKSSSGLDITSNILSLFKSSGGVESGIYKYYEKTLHPYEFSKLDARFGRTMTGLSVASSLAGTASEGIDTYKIFSDSNSTAFDKAAQSIKMCGSIFDFGGKAYIAKKASSKTLQFISSASGSPKAVNQILATEQKLKYTTSAAATKNISKANTIVALVNVTASTISSGVKRYGEVTADGKCDVVDASSVGVHSCLSGLNTVSSSLTLGLVHFDSEKVATDIENDADNFARGDSWAAKYIRNQDNNVILRFGVSVGSGGYLLGKKVVNGVADGAKTVGSWISTGWNVVTNLY